MARIFKTPFAAQGDTDEIPEATQGDGSVSLTQGWGFDYQREYEDPAAKDIRREDMNGLFHDITEAIGEIQLTGVARWSPEGAPYPEGALVWSDGVVWESLTGNNSAEPTEGANWSMNAGGYLQASQNLGDLDDAEEARSNLGLGNAATQDVGTSSGTVAAGNDSRITGAAQKSANLSDLLNISTARDNLGRGEFGLGVGQTWQDMTGARSVGTNYTNTTGRPILVSIHAFGNGSWTRLSLTVDGLLVGSNSTGASQGSDTGEYAGVQSVVPSGSVYSAGSLEGTISTWAELR